MTDEDAETKIDDETTLVVNALPQFPGYTTLRELGSGGMARVYLARENSLDRLVAIKVINASLTDPDFLVRFEMEAKNTARSKHRNIVGVHALGKFEDRPYIAFEYLAGGTLEERLQQGVLAETEARQVAYKTASALAYLHERGVIHRDLKPANILFDEDGEPILCDFGIAKTVTEDPNLTRTGVVIGSPKYMSPEQLRGEPLDPASDMYSFGLVVAQMLTGEVPSPPSSPNLEGPLAPYEAMIAGCLTAQPAERWSAQACVETLAELGGGPTGAASRWPRRAGVALLIAALLAVGVWGGWLGSSPPSLTVNGALPDTVLYLDGLEMSSPAIELTPGQHQLFAVTSGYYAYDGSVQGDADVAVNLALEPLELPSQETFQEFHAAFEGAPTEAPVATGYRLFDELLLLRHAIDRDYASEVATQSARIAALASAGDTAARVQAFLLQLDNHVDIGLATTLNWLEAASREEAFALATYYRALHFRQQQTDQEQRLDPNALPEFRRLMKLAYDQGLGFAQAELDAIDRLGQRNDS